MDYEDLLINSVERIILDRVLVPCKLTGGKRGAFRVPLQDGSYNEVGYGIHHRLDNALDIAVSQMNYAGTIRADMVAEVQDARRDSGL